MTTRLTTKLALLAALTVLPTTACDKNKGETKDPGDDVKTDEPGEPTEPAEPVIPPQDPDPAEIAQLWDRYLKGEFEAVANEAAGFRTAWSADTQIRASGKAAALQALAAAQLIPENAKEPAESAVAAGDKLKDADLQQLAALAHASYLIGVQDAAGAQAKAQAITEGPYAGLARIIQAEAVLNQAFGEGEQDDQIVAPEKLDEAKAQYEAASADASPLIQARGFEGIAAIEKYKGNKKGVCEPAFKAADLFAGAGATEDRSAAPAELAGEAKCKKPK